MAAIFSEEEKKRYIGVNVDILSSNNPGCLYPLKTDNEAEPSSKHVMVFKPAREFMRAYEDVLRPAIVEVLKARNLTEYPNSFLQIHVMDYGFSPLSTKPTTVVIFPRGLVSAELARDIIADIVKSVFSYTIPKHSPPVFIDICEGKKTEGKTPAESE